MQSAENYQQEAYKLHVNVLVTFLHIAIYLDKTWQMAEIRKE